MMISRLYHRSGSPSNTVAARGHQKDDEEHVEMDFSHEWFSALASEIATPVSTRETSPFQLAA